MSDDTSGALKWDEAGDENAAVRRYRFGFLHAVALPVLALLGASTVYSLSGLGFERFRDIEVPSGAFVNEWDHAIAEDFASTGKEPGLWERAKDYGREALSGFKRQLGEAARRQHEQALTDAFAKLDQNDARQVREFLATHRNNPYAAELGYVGAAERAMSEGRLYRAGDVTACGKCWCWREPPPITDDPAATQ